MEELAFLHAWSTIVVQSHQQHNICKVPKEVVAACMADPANVSAYRAEYARRGLAKVEDQAVDVAVPHRSVPSSPQVSRVDSAEHHL